MILIEKVMKITKKDVEEKFKDKKIKKRTFDADEPLELEALEGFRLIECTFSQKNGERLILNNCKKCRVIGCHFPKKTTKGVSIKITGEESDGNIIEGCDFREHSINDTNGGECIRIGENNFSGCIFNTTVRYCSFLDLETGEPESISIKSCGNTFEYNTHERCTSSVTIRHGGYNKILNNTFIGSGGIRVYGAENEVKGNWHENNNSKKFPPLTIPNGNLEDDPNFEAEKPNEPPKPLKKPKEGCRHDAYARAKNNTIEDNTYVNCQGTCISWGHKDYADEKKKKCGDNEYTQKGPILPKDNKFRRNSVIADDNDSEVLGFILKDDLTAPTMESLRKRLKDNTFEDIRLYGKKAKRGLIPQEAINDSPGPKPTKPQTGPGALRSESS
jgi:hypothetical protein